MFLLGCILILSRSNVTYRRKGTFLHFIFCHLHNVSHALPPCLSSRICWSHFSSPLLLYILLMFTFAGYKVLIIVRNFSVKFINISFTDTIKWKAYPLHGNTWWVKMQNVAHHIHLIIASKTDTSFKPCSVTRSSSLSLPPCSESKSLFIIAHSTCFSNNFCSEPHSPSTTFCCHLGKACKTYLAHANWAYWQIIYDLT